ncbi:MAG: hypothetical protein ACTSPR_03165, partial [Candidatus Thorarchaeota archaeon]
ADVSRNVQRSGKAYDPVEAQVREVLNSTAEVFQKEWDNLKVRWSKLIKKPIPVELDRIESEANSKIQMVRVLADGGSGRMAYPRQLDWLAHYLRHCIESAKNLMSMISDYERVEDPWTSSKSFAEVITSLSLDAAKRVTAEIAQRASLDGSKLLPVYDSRYGSWRLDSLYVDTYRGEESTTLISVLDVHKYRLGALPLLAHQVAHVIVRNSREVNPVAKIAWSILRKEDDSDYSNKMKSMFSFIGSSKMYTPSDSDSAKILAEHLLVAHRWSEEVYCDLLATSLVGPSYVYALSRFSTGTFTEFSNKPSGHESDPPLPERVGLCLDLLEFTQIRPVFESPYLPWEYERLPNEVLSGITSEIANLYSVRDHEEATGRIRKELINGHVVEAPAILVLNALWDAVVKKEGYANEIAAFVSVAGERDKIK